MKREKKMILIFGAIILVAIVIFSIFEFSSREDDDNDDKGYEEPPLDEIGIEVMDAFRTDRTTIYNGPPVFGMDFLVLDVEFDNNLSKDVTIYRHMIVLKTTSNDLGVVGMEQTVPDSMDMEEDILANHKIRKFLFFALYPYESPLNLSYADTTFNVTFYKNMDGISPDTRNWTNPLMYEVTGCGRDENGSGKEEFLYFMVQVTNPGRNGSYFRNWLMDLECWNGVQLDGLFVDQSDGDFLITSGMNMTWKVYFDIPLGSPDRPKVLYEDIGEMYIEIDSSMYEGLI